MNIVRDILFLQLNCILQFFVREPAAFRLTVLLALFCAALSWLACSRFCRLWNVKYRLILTHHLLCAFSALVTFCFVICFPSLKFTKDAALISIGIWRTAIGMDSLWSAQTYREAYQSVRALGVEDFSAFPPPDRPNSRIPVNHAESRVTVASVYANTAARNFRQHWPFLSVAVWPHSRLPAQVVRQDVDAWDFHRGDYPVSRAIDIAATQIRSQLDPQASHVVWIMRLMALAAFLLAQSIPFGVIGWAAYRDIKINT